MFWLNFAFMCGAYVIALGLVIALFLSGEISKYVFMGAIVFFAFVAGWVGYVYAFML